MKVKFYMQLSANNCWKINLSLFSCFKLSLTTFTKPTLTSIWWNVIGEKNLTFKSLCLGHFAQSPSS